MQLNRKVSVIIPCFNEERFIEDTVKAVLTQDYPGNLMEIMIADGQSTDGTIQILERLSSVHDNIRIFENLNKTVPYAFNMCIPESKGEVIVIIGAHSEIPVNYVSTLVKYLYDLNAANVGGVLETIAPDNSYKSMAIALACSSKIGMGNSHFRIGSSKIREVDTVPFGCYNKDIFDKVGLFDTELTRNQDDEFNSRVIKGGGKIFLIPELKLKYFSRNSYSKLWRMFHQYGLFKPLVGKKIGRPSTIRQLVPPLFVVSVFTLFFLSFLHIYFAVILIFEIILYELVILISGWKLQERSKSISVLAHFLISIYVIHFAYGTGYLNGLKKIFLFRNSPSNEKLKSSR